MSSEETDKGKKGSLKPFIIVGALFIYMCVMAVSNIDTLTRQHDYLRYFGTLGAELFVLGLLLVFLRKREKLKREREEDLKRAAKERKALERKNSDETE